MATLAQRFVASIDRDTLGLMPTMNLKLAGILPPLTTPFNDRDQVDLPALARNVTRYDETSVVGFVVFGSSGEAVHLSRRERREILVAVRQTVRPDRTIVAGVNALSLGAAIEAIEAAAEDGADAALVVTPYFYKSAMTQTALEDFFGALADRSALPILLYNIPQNTGVTLTPATISTLAMHEQIVGIKDSSGDLAALASTIRRTSTGFAVLIGQAGILFPGMVMGATGGVLGVACVAPEVCVALFEAAHSGDVTGARELQHRLSPLGRMVTAELGVAGLKAAMDLASYVGGAPRSPLRSIGEKERASLAEIMVATGFFPDLL